MPARLRALLATARIANVPSVVSNVLTGMMLLVVFDSRADAPGWNQQTLFPVIAACCLYVAGNFLNDWFDFAWDQQHRPERAIPSGLFPRDLYLSISMVLTLAGMTMSWWVSKTVFFTYVIILCSVIAYTLLHKRHSFSIWIMGACRAGLYALGLGAMSPGFGILRDFFSSWQEWEGLALAGVILIPLLGMLTYIAGISLLARFESRPVELGSMKWLAALLLLFPVLTHMTPWAAGQSLGFPFSHTWIGACGLLPLLGWTLFVVCSSAGVGKKVARLLAGIALVDLVYMFSMCWALYAMVGYSPVLWFPSISLLAFLLALLLQKVAPAT
ncbi:MAG: UbiA family prenyltransferase [Akkermansiaceae bacterium]